MALQILLVWAEGPPEPEEVEVVMKALGRAQRIFNTLAPNALPFNIWGQVNREEQGPLPATVGYTEDQDYVLAGSVAGDALAHVRDLYLDASNRGESPVYVLFIVREILGANGFSLGSGYCSVLPVPTGVEGTADGHTYAHEIGHGLSLPHDKDPDNLMYPYRVVQGEHQLSGDDITVDQYKLMRTFLAKNPTLLQP
jgi:hypothetical protein